MHSRLHVLLTPGPPMLVRGRKWLLIATLACFVIAGTYVILDDPLNLPHRRWWKLAATCAALFPVVVLQPLWFFRTRHLRRLARERQGLLCPHCAYDISTPIRGVASDNPDWPRSGEPIPPSVVAHLAKGQSSRISG